MISVIIPAHNEAQVIGRCLDGLLEGIDPGGLEVIVACNGCTDDTAEIAGAYGPPVRVIDVPRASKIAALNAGDEAASGFPRFYVDADIEMTGSALRATADALEQTGALAAAPRLTFDTSRSTWPVRAFYRVWTALPYFTGGGMIGSGVYALAEAGRARFDRFPDIIADDGYVRSLFTPAERLTVEGASFRIVAPQTLSGVVKIKTRSRFGNMELAEKFPKLAKGKETTTGSMLGLLACRPNLWPATVVYVYVQWRTKGNCRRKLAAGDYRTWERDDSSRRR